MDIKEKLNVAFKTMRKAGMIARQKYLCCGSCAVSSIASELKKPNKRTKPIGFVYYTRQDWEDSVDRDFMYLGFGSDGTEGTSAEQIGALVFASCVKAGLTVEWSGDTSERILVSLK